VCVCVLQETKKETVSKGLPEYCGPPLQGKQAHGQLAGGQGPSGQSLSSIPASTSNDLLISKLFESLESLKLCPPHSHSASGVTSPGPLSISTSCSREGNPSSPTEVQYDFSRGATLSSENSNENFAAAVQQLTLGNHQQIPCGVAPNHLTVHGPNHNNAHLGNSGFPSLIGDPVNFQPNLSIEYLSMLQSAMHSEAAVQVQAQQGKCQFPGQLPKPMPMLMPLPMHTTTTMSGTGQAVISSTQGTAGSNFASTAATAIQLAYGQVLTAGGAGPPLYEECLVGLEGAYQSYCRQVITEELNQSAFRMLSQLKTMQVSDPPAVSRLIGKRYFCSLKEVSKVVSSARLLLVAPDVRPSPTAHIKPVRLLQMVLASADASGVPYVFCLSRRGIGQVFGRDKSMSIVAVMHLDGVEQEYLALLNNAAQGRALYETYRSHGSRSVGRPRPSSSLGVSHCKPPNCFGFHP